MNFPKAFFVYYFPFAVWTSLFVLCIFAVVMFKIMVHMTPEDYADYSRVMAEANPGLIKKSSLASYTATQQRQGIRKDYIFNRGSERLHLRLISADAELMMQQKDGGEFVEKMQNVQCFMQEELYYQLPDGREAIKQSDGQLSLRQTKEGQPDKLSDSEVRIAVPMQQIHYFEAKEASYHYKDDTFYADDVQIRRYVALGHLLPETLVASPSEMQGRAESMEFSLSGGELNFKAIGFKAQFNTSGRKL